MARLFDVHIENLDGTTEDVQNVEETQIRDGVLRLLGGPIEPTECAWRTYADTREDLGNYPLTSIRKWTTTYA